VTPLLALSLIASLINTWCEGHRPLFIHWRWRAWQEAVTQAECLGIAQSSLGYLRSPLAEGRSLLQRDLGLLEGGGCQLGPFLFQVLGMSAHTCGSLTEYVAQLLIRSPSGLH
jgi:hypothetical protein